VIFAALVLVPGTAGAQGVPVGPEFRVNSFTPGAQREPSVAADSAGNFVVVWQSYSQDPLTGVFGQRYTSSGAPLGPEFRINTYTTSFQGDAAVAADGAGNFVVVWNGDLQDGSGTGVFAQRYASSGAPLGTEFRVNTYTTGSQGLPSVAIDAAGNFVVVWQGPGPGDSSYTGVFGQRYASSGAPLGAEFRVNTFTPGAQTLPKAASNASGNIVVVWQSSGQDGSEDGVFAQRYAGTGERLGTEFRVNAHTTDSQAQPSVTADPSGGFVVVWTSLLQDGSDLGVFAQRYESSGAPAGLEFRINGYTTGPQSSPSVASDGSGNFVVVWVGAGPGDANDSILGQRYASSGASLGPEFLVNTYTTSYQNVPVLAAGAAGEFVVAWQSYTQDGSDFGIFGQRFGPIVPVQLLDFSVE
jgi:hypothetical protein